MKLTLAITVYNRYEMLLESFANVIDDDRIDEILIMDDHSDEEFWKKIKDLPAYNPKIKVVRQLANRGMSVNKRDAVFHSKNEWVIIFDSDNVVGKDYLDAFEKSGYWFTGHDSSIIYMPSFAMPSFDYRKYEGRLWNRTNIPPIAETMANCALNTCNYVVEKNKYLQVWQENKEMKGSDTVWFNYLWLKSGYSLAIVEGMNYFHRVHKDSGFLKDCDYNMKKAEEIKQLIMCL